MDTEPARDGGTVSVRSKVVVACYLAGGYGVVRIILVFKDYQVGVCHDSGDSINTQGGPATPDKYLPCPGSRDLKATKHEFSGAHLSSRGKVGEGGTAGGVGQVDCGYPDSR